MLYWSCTYFPTIDISFTFDLKVLWSITTFHITKAPLYGKFYFSCLHVSYGLMSVVNWQNISFYYTYYFRKGIVWWELSIFLWKLLAYPVKLQWYFTIKLEWIFLNCKNPIHIKLQFEIAVCALHPILMFLMTWNYPEIFVDTRVTRRVLPSTISTQK